MKLEEIAYSRSIWLLSGLVMISAGLFLSFWQPSGKAEDSICFLRRVVEIPCPGCGLTRGFAALAKWEFAKAVGEHPLSPFFALEAVIGWLFWGFMALLRPPLVSVALLNLLLILQVTLLLAVWGLRLTTGSLGG
jgi:hypothetical protein